MSAPACVGCGWCCLENQCDESHRLHGYMPRCPELRWDDGGRRYVCKLVGSPEHGERARAALFVGQGCCNRFSSWRGDVRDRG